MKRVISVLMLLMLCRCGVRASADMGYSGMVRISEDTFLTVNDLKANVPGARLGTIIVTAAKGTEFRPLEVVDWKDGDGPASDLEACSAIPGRDGEYLLAESGYFRKKYGRLFHVRVTRNGQNVWQAEVVKAFRVLERPGGEGITADWEQVEGIGCFRAGEKTILVYATRGKRVEGKQYLSRLVWGELDFKSYRFTRWGETPLLAVSLLHDRDCSDLLVKPENNSWAVWSVATVDIGDLGPFRSVVYRAGMFMMNAMSGKAEFVLNQSPGNSYEVQGLKIEALAEPAATVPGSIFSIATDDESYGGVWRPLF